MAVKNAVSNVPALLADFRASLAGTAVSYTHL